jgi:predicted dehydrogenase
MSLRLGIVGTGQFAQGFIPLFKAHPLVGELSLCDINAGKLAAAAERFGVRRTFPSLDAIAASDVDAVAIFTQNWLHGPQAAQALRAGKHVYSAVPPGISLDELRDLVRAVEETGRVYMLGETSYYYPAVIYCRQKFAEGAFGHVVYAEGNYYHDYDHGLYEVMQARGGADWRRYAGSPPMHYPTHSTSAVLSVTGARLTHVSCQGWVDRHADGLFRADANRWGNVFSDESALFRASDGSIVRINEFRRIGGLGGERATILGTEASFEHSQTGHWWLPKNGTRQCVDELLRHAGREFPGRGVYNDMSQVHPVERLPVEFVGLPNSHAGSHQFLVDDFVKAVAAGAQPALDVWSAARFCAPGLVAHESARRGGELLEIPDFGPGSDSELP